MTDASHLGVKMATNLTWGMHTSSMISKAYRTLCFLCHNIRSATYVVKEQAYKTLVRHHVKYGSVVWSPHTTKEI